MTEYPIVRSGNTPGLPLGVEIQLIHKEAKVPVQAKHSDAGYDLHSIGAGLVRAQSRTIISTGIALAIPEGFVGYVKPRSGLADRYGISVLGGVIDSGYRGEIKVMLHNNGREKDFAVNVGDRIAQLVIQPVEKVAFLEVKELGESHRGDSGFGSTGV